MADERVRDLGLAAISHDREQRRHRSLRDKRACEAFELATGMLLPEVISFRDEGGNLFEISVHAEIRLVEKGAQE